MTQYGLISPLFVFCEFIDLGLSENSQRKDLAITRLLKYSTGALYKATILEVESRVCTRPFGKRNSKFLASILNAEFDSVSDATLRELSIFNVLSQKITQ